MARRSASVVVGGLAVLWGLIVGAEVLGAAASGAASEPADEFRVFSQTVTQVEGGAVTVHHWNVGTNRFAFRLPGGWSVRPDAVRRRLELQDAGVTMGVSICLVPRDPKGATKPGAEVWRERVRQLLPTTQVVQESACVTGLGKAAVFDAEEKVSAGVRASSRVVFVPVSEGVLEFQLRTTSALFAEAQKSLGRILGGFGRQTER